MFSFRKKRIRKYFDSSFKIEKKIQNSKIFFRSISFIKSKIPKIFFFFRIKKKRQMEIRKKKLPFTFEILKVQIKRKGIFTSFSFKKKSIKKIYIYFL